MSKDELLRLDNQLCFAVYACSKEIIRLYRPLLDALGITYTQYLVLLVLWETTPITFKELSQRLYLDSGTLTPVLKKMEKNNLLLRQRMLEDERQVIVALTDKGKALKQDAYSIPQQMMCSSPLNPTEAIALRDTIHNLLKQLPKGEGENI
ncbi:MarR family winged helix-turn-helix transcriptional regulator [Pelosinus sp. UFO1]|uniref:MarR family winged helix-turn-helix transcriptional regulator n=1 Tax=Pelosinus sp. UFO1 TaxID=484770 RepID=UPI0004D1C327|nr:MarR family transcriptional regulator [Pelosinus sp. UFO1]AIF49945.1 transcriptional regulator, MarR family [Pelosinus sp. UFO1]